MTDFGDDHYVAQMKAVILSTCPEALIQDITHRIKAQNIRQAAYILQSTYKLFRSELVPIHLCVVDPSVGSKRKGLCIKTGHGFFIGPDNGVLYPSVSEDENFEAREIDISTHRIDGYGATFDGRDLFAPVAVFLFQGNPFEEIGPVVDEINCLDIDKFELLEGKKDIIIECKPLDIDNFGNIITNLDNNDFQKILVKYGINKIYLINGPNEIPLQLKKIYFDVPVGNLLLCQSSSGRIEISLRNGNASKRLDISLGDNIIFKLTV